MTPKQSLMMLILGALFLIGIIMLVRAQKFREKYSLVWIGISLLILTAPLLHDFYIQIGIFLGIINYISFLSFFAFLTLFLLSIQFTIALTVAYNQRKEIAQSVALLEGRIAELEKRLTQQTSSPALSQQPDPDKPESTP